MKQTPWLTLAAVVVVLALPVSTAADGRKRILDPVRVAPAPAVADGWRMTLVDPADETSGGRFINGTSKGLIVNAGCRSTLKLLKTTLADTDGLRGVSDPRDEVICIVTSRSNRFPGVDIASIYRGEVKNGDSVMIRDSTKEKIGCLPGGGLINTQLDAVCYEPDPTFVPTLTISSSTDPIEGVVIPAPAPPTTPVLARSGTFIP